MFSIQFAANVNWPAEECKTAETRKEQECDKGQSGWACSFDCFCCWFIICTKNRKVIKLKLCLITTPTTRPAKHDKRHPVVVESEGDRETEEKKAASLVSFIRIFCVKGNFLKYCYLLWLFWDHSQLIMRINCNFTKGIHLISCC